MRGWSNHLQGAATLLDTRGVDVSNCVLGRKGMQLFLQFRSQVVRHSNYRLPLLKSDNEAVDE
jgi:hypothetical protein